MAEIYGKQTGLCDGYGGSMHLVDVERGFLGTSGIVAQGIPQATGAAYAAQIRGEGQVVLCFFGDGASKQGAFARVAEHRLAVEAPDRLRDGEQQLQRRHAQRAGGRERGRRRAAGGQGEGATAMPGVTVDGGDPRRGPRDGRARRSRARAPARARRSSSRKVYRLSAHGNIIAPPGVPLHFPEHEAIEVFGDRRGVRGRAARRPGPALPRPARRGRHAERRGGRRDRGRGPRRDAGGGRLRAREPVPGPPSARLDHVYA